MRCRQIAALLASSLAMCLWTACQAGKTNDVYAVYTGGNARRGRDVIDHYRCGACHTIPGIPNANGLVGPPLLWFGRRTFIAGELPNKPENLVRWVESPKSVEPGTAMPTLGLSEQEARDVAAYLYTLR
jgi:cytochrome c1